MAWAGVLAICIGILAAIILLVSAGYCIGRDSRIHEIEDKADDRAYAAREIYRQEAAALRKDHLKELHELFDAVEAAFEAKMPQTFEPLTGTCGEPKQ